MRSFSAVFVLVAAAVVLVVATSSASLASPQAPQEAAVAEPFEAVFNESEESGAASDAGEEDDDDTAPSPRHRLARRQFTPLVTADTMHMSVADTMKARMQPTLPPGAAMPFLPGSFNAREVFAIFNRHKSSCLAVKPHSKHPKLVTQRCQLNQAFALNSPLSFHWLPAENNLARLAIIYNGQQLCARHRWKGTYFYPCSDHSTKYSLSATSDKGQFQIRDASRSFFGQCMDAEFHHALRMKACGRWLRDQRWEKFHVAFMH
jgi:hypothetical protein